MNLDNMGGPERATRILRLLSSLANADNELHAAELSFLRQLGQQQGLNDTQIAEAIVRPSVRLVPPESEQERMQVLYYLIFLSRADGQLVEAEANSVHSLGLRLGFRESMITRFIALAREQMDGNIPQADMLDTIRRYLN